MDQLTLTLNKLKSTFTRDDFDSRILVDLINLVRSQSSERVKQSTDMVLSELRGLLYDETGRMVCTPQLYCAIYSGMLQLEPREEHLIELAELVLTDDTFGWQNVFYLTQRLGQIAFLYPSCNTSAVNILLWRLFAHSVELFQSVTTLDLTPMSIEELTGGVPVVLTSQFLSDGHGPTKTALDRALVLKRRFGNVLIINTAEFLSDVGRVPFFDTHISKYDESLLAAESISWKGTSIPYFQCDRNMPDESMIDMLLQTIRGLKPPVCIAIGGASIVASVVNKVVPTMVVGCTQSNLSYMACDYQVADKYQIDLDRQVIEILGLQDRIIEGRFTFALKDRTEYINREKAGLKTGAFVLCAVGARLDVELDEVFWGLMEKLSCENIQIALIGRFSRYDEIVRMYPCLADRLINMGFCEDAISRISLCDLYINPHRKGGATSSVEALSVGVPVVTENYGDVAGTVGEQYFCESLGESVNLVKQYMYDREFYDHQSAYGLELARSLLDSDSEFNRVIDEYLARRKTQ